MISFCLFVKIITYSLTNQNWIMYATENPARTEKHLGFSKKYTLTKQLLIKTLLQLIARDKWSSTVITQSLSRCTCVSSIKINVPNNAANYKPLFHWFFFCNMMTFCQFAYNNLLCDLFIKQKKSYQFFTFIWDN